MEILLSAIIASLLGYLISKLEKMELKLNELENIVLIINSHMPKRKEDNEIY